MIHDWSEVSKQKNLWGILILDEKMIAVQGKFMNFEFSKSNMNDYMWNQSKSMWNNVFLWLVIGFELEEGWGILILNKKNCTCVSQVDEFWIFEVQPEWLHVKSKQINVK